MTIIDTDTGEIIEALSMDEQSELAECEAKIERGLQTFYEVGEALLKIRDSRLYRNTHGSFEAYCQDKWQLKKRQAYLIMDATEVVNNLKGDPGIILPIAERHVRPLTQLEPDAQKLVWDVVQKTAPNGKPTAAHVKSVVDILKTVTKTGAIDNGNGIDIPVHVATFAHLKAAVTEETYERMKRQELHIAARAPLFTSNTDEWNTPQEILRRVLAVLGEIDLDPCSNSIESPNVPAKSHYTESMDGLSKEWCGRVYMNPPYGDVIGDWTKKLVSEYRAGRVTQALALVPARTDTQWFREFREFPRCFIIGRLKFGDAANGATFPSVVINLGCDHDRFLEVFGAIGDVYELAALND
jgi:DNA N-6-adenine-methyltransferase Dam